MFELQIFARQVYFVVATSYLGLGYLIHVREYIGHLRFEVSWHDAFLKPPGFNIQCNWVFSVEDDI